MNYGAIVGAQIAARNARAIAEQRMAEKATRPIDPWAYSEPVCTDKESIILAVVVLAPFVIWGIVELIKEHRGDK